MAWLLNVLFDAMEVILLFFTKGSPPEQAVEPPKPPLPEVQIPEPTIEPPPPPKYEWGNVLQIRHSMRVIGDEFNMDVIQKDLLCDIGWCESEYKLRAIRVNSPHSIDRGLFQWNNYYHPEITDEIAYDPEAATRLACHAILQKKAHLYWSASEHCWNKNRKYDSLL